MCNCAFARYLLFVWDDKALAKLRCKEHEGLFARVPKKYKLWSTCEKNEAPKVNTVARSNPQKTFPRKPSLSGSPLYHISRHPSFTKSTTLDTSWNQAIYLTTTYFDRLLAFFSIFFFTPAWHSSLPDRRSNIVVASSGYSSLSRNFSLKPPTVQAAWTALTPQNIIYNIWYMLYNI